MTQMSSKGALVSFSSVMRSIEVLRFLHAIHEIDDEDFLMAGNAMRVDPERFPTILKFPYHLVRRLFLVGERCDEPRRVSARILKTRRP